MPDSDDMVTLALARIEQKLDAHVTGPGHPGHEQVHTDIVKRLDDICLQLVNQNKQMLDFAGKVAVMALTGGGAIIVLLAGVAFALVAIVLHLKP